MPAVQIDGNNVLEVERETKKAVDHIRAGKGPYFIEAITYRFRPHSMFDPELYRDKAEVQEAKKRDPIILFVDFLKDEKLLTDAELAAIEQDVAAVVQHSVDFAEESPWEAVEDLTRFVYSERT
jgi:TPP-dependent pyruvate/acetoin dehydrogenase alpha subunit